MKRRISFTTALVLAILLIFGSTWTAFAEDEVKEYYIKGNTIEINGYTAFKPTDDVSPGSHADGTLDVEYSVHGDGKLLDWESNIPVKYVYVKGGSLSQNDPDEFNYNILNDIGGTVTSADEGNAGGRLYIYEPAVTSGTGLEALPGHQISHVTFYYQNVGDIEIKKTLETENGEPHAGVTFYLYKVELMVSSTTEVAPFKTGVTDDNGVLKFEGLIPGDYELVEVVPPGYESSLNETNNNILVEANTTKEVSVINALIKGSIEVKKTLETENGEPHVGVEFSLYQGETHIATGETNEDGILLFDGLLPGDYQLEEVVPNGYESDVEDIGTITLKGSEKISLNVINKEITIIIEDPEEPLSPADPEDPKEDPKEDPEDEEEIIVIEDEKTPLGGAKLPQTGGTPDTLFYGAGIALTLLGSIIRKKR